MSQSMANDELERVVDFLEKITDEGLGDPAERMPWLAVKDDGLSDYDDVNKSTTATTTTATSSSASEPTKAQAKPKAQLKDKQGKGAGPSQASKGGRKESRMQAAVGEAKKPAEEKKTVKLRVAAQKPKQRPQADQRRSEKEADRSEVVGTARNDPRPEEQKKGWLGLF